MSWPRLSTYVASLLSGRISKRGGKKIYGTIDFLVKNNAKYSAGITKRVMVDPAKRPKTTVSASPAQNSS